MGGRFRPWCRGVPWRVCAGVYLAGGVGAGGSSGKFFRLVWWWVSVSAGRCSLSGERRAVLPGLFPVGRVGVSLGLGFLQEIFSGWSGGFVWLGNSIRGNNGVAGIRGVDVGLGLGAGVSVSAGGIPYRAVAGLGCFAGVVLAGVVCPVRCQRSGWCSAACWRARWVGSVFYLVGGVVLGWVC